MSMSPSSCNTKCESVSVFLVLYLHLTRFRLLLLVSQVIILGDGAVGKTSIAMRHTEDNFSNVYKQTIGLDFFLKRLALPGAL